VQLSTTIKMHLVRTFYQFQIPYFFNFSFSLSLSLSFFLFAFNNNVSFIKYFIFLTNKVISTFLHLHFKKDPKNKFLSKTCFTQKFLSPLWQVRVDSLCCKFILNQFLIMLKERVLEEKNGSRCIDKRNGHPRSSIQSR